MGACCPSAVADLNHKESDHKLISFQMQIGDKTSSVKNVILPFYRRVVSSRRGWRRVSNTVKCKTINTVLQQQFRISACYYLPVPTGTELPSVADPDPNPDPSDPYVLGLLDPDPFVRGMDADHSTSSKNSKKNLDSYRFVTFLTFFL